MGEFDGVGQGGEDEVAGIDEHCDSGVAGGECEYFGGEDRLVRRAAVTDPQSSGGVGVAGVSELSEGALVGVECGC